MSFQPIHEVDCTVEDISPEVVEAFLDIDLSDDPMIVDSIHRITDELCQNLHPKGVYKLFNPATCTLPPKYVEPAIKLISTVVVLRGEAAYERMMDAQHTAMAVSTVGSDEEIEALRARTVHNELDATLFDACLESMTSLVADKLSTAIDEDAHEMGLQRGSMLESGTEDFPLSTNKTICFFTQTEKRLGLTSSEEGAPSNHWSTLGVIGLYNETKKKRRGCAYCHNVKTCTIRKVGMTCHGRRRKAKKPLPKSAPTE